MEENRRGIVIYIIVLKDSRANGRKGVDPGPRVLRRMKEKVLVIHG
jgi:hypothetical protein